jgi:membrane protein required for colicin V production
MEGFTIVDGVVAGLIVVSAILAYARGLTREGMAIVGWIAAAVLAFTFAGAAEPLVREIPYAGEVLGESCELAVIASFALVFALSLVILSLFTPLLSSAVRNSAIGPIDQGLGFLFGVLRGALLVAVAFVVYDRVIVNEGIPAVEQSRSATIFSRAQAAIEAQIPEDAPGWIVGRYETLVGECGAPVGTAPVIDG